MGLIKISIKNFRNIAEINLDLSPKYNIFYGANGSGKTSILEALYYLGIGRSFRSHVLQRIVKNNADFFTLFGEVQRGECDKTFPIGVERFNNGGCKIRIAGKDLKSLVGLVKIFPVILITQDGFEIFNGGSKERRKLIDWGVFHVEHAFLSLWRKFNRILLQRNALLRESARSSSIRIWDNELANVANDLHVMRERYIAEFLPAAMVILEKFLGSAGVQARYHPGWDVSKSFSDVLEESLSGDARVGFTQHGPHRADLKFKIDGIPVQHVLSRGQQKLLIFALHLAQGVLFHQATGHRCAYLIDDLAAELDVHSREIIKNAFDEMGAQVFLTSLYESSDLQQFFGDTDVKMFHVEQGTIIN